MKFIPCIFFNSLYFICFGFTTAISCIEINFQWGWFFRYISIPRSRYNWSDCMWIFTTSISYIQCFFENHCFINSFNNIGVCSLLFAIVVFWYHTISILLTATGLTKLKWTCFVTWFATFRTPTSLFFYLHWDWKVMMERLCYWISFHQWSGWRYRTCRGR